MADEQVAQPQESSKPKKQQDPAVGAIASVDSTIKAIITKLNGVTATLEGYGNTKIGANLFETIKANASAVNIGYNAIIEAALTPPKKSEIPQPSENSDSTGKKPDKQVADMIKGIGDIANKLKDLPTKEAITNYTSKSDEITAILNNISPEGQDSPIKTAVERISALVGQIKGLSVEVPDVNNLKQNIGQVIGAVSGIITKLAVLGTETTTWHAEDLNEGKGPDGKAHKVGSLKKLNTFKEYNNNDEVDGVVYSVASNAGTFVGAVNQIVTSLTSMNTAVTQLINTKLDYKKDVLDTLKTNVSGSISSVSALIQKLAVIGKPDDKYEEDVKDESGKVIHEKGSIKKENPYNHSEKFDKIQSNMGEVIKFLPDMLSKVETLIRDINGRTTLLTYKKAGQNEQTPLGVVNSVIGDVAKCIASVVKIFSNPKSTGKKIASEFSAGGWKDTYEVIDEYDKDVAGYIEKLSNVLGKGDTLDTLLTAAVDFNNRWDQPLRTKFGKITQTKKNKEGKDEDVEVDQVTGLSLAAMIVKNIATIITQIVGAMDAVETMTGKVQKGGYGMFHVITFLDSMINVLINFDDKWFPTLDAHWGKITVMKKLKLKNDKEGGDVLKDISEDVFKTNSYTILVAVFGQVVKCLELIKDILDDKNVDEVVNNPSKIKKKLSSLPVLFEFVVETVTTSVAKLDAVITSEDKAKGIAILLTSIAAILKNMFEVAKLLEENSKIYKGKKYRKMMKQVRGYIDDVCDLIRYISVKSARTTKTSEAAQKGTDAIVAVFKNLVQIPILLLKLAGTFLLALVVSPLIMLALVSIYGLIKFIIWLFKSKTMAEDAEKIKQGVDSVTTTIKNLIKLCLQLMLLAAISVIAIVAMIPVMLFMGALTLFIIGVSKTLVIIDKFDGKSARIKILHLAKIIKSLIVIVVELILLAPLALIAIIAMIPVMLFMGTLTLFVMGLKLMLIIIDKFDGRKTRAKLWRLQRLICVLGLIALSLILLAPVAAIAILAMIVVLGFMLALSLFVLAVWMIAWLLSKFVSMKMLLSLMALTLIIGILLVISLMILGITLIAIVVAPHWLDILIFMGVMLGVVVIVIAIGWLAMLATPILGIAIIGLFLILVLMGIILGIAMCLKLISMISLDPEAIMASVRTVLDTAWFVVENIFNSHDDASKKDGDSENRGFFGWIADRFKDVIGGIGAIITLILGVFYLVLVFVAIALILMIAGCLYLLQNIELHPDAIAANLVVVFDCADKVIDSVFNRDDPNTNQTDVSERKSFGDWIKEKLTSVLGGIGKILKLLLSIVYLVLLFVAVGLVLGIVLALNEIGKFNLDSTAIGSNMDKIFACADTVMAKVYDSKDEHKGEDSGGFWSSVLSGLGFSAVGNLLKFISGYAYLSRILSTIQIVSKIADALNSIVNIGVKETDISKSITSIFNLADVVESKLKGKKLDNKTRWEYVEIAKYYITLFGAINKASKEIAQVSTDLDGQLKSVENILKVIKTPVSKDTLSTHERLINNYIKFLDKVDRVDIENLKTTERLFENMAKFSESIHGNFQGLADALNEKIAPLLEELKDLLKEVKPSIEQASKDTQASITYNATGNSERAAQRAGLPQEQVQQARQTEENKKRANYERLAAIDKIVKLLEGEYKNGAKVRMV